jgi:hypothetical protein
MDAASRAQKRFRNRRRDVREIGAVKLVPIVSGELARRMAGGELAGR